MGDNSSISDPLLRKDTNISANTEISINLHVTSTTIGIDKKIV